MVEGKRYPAALAYLTFGDEGALLRGRRWGREYGTDIGCQDWGEEFVGCLMRCEEGVC